MPAAARRSWYGSGPSPIAYTGCRCRCRSSWTWSPSVRSRWGARCGTRRIGPVETRCTSPSRVTRRPASPSSRSSQVPSSGPPYTSTPSCCQPADEITGVRLELERRRVGVGSDDAYAVVGPPTVGHPPGDDGAVAHHVLMVAEWPAVGLADRGVRGGVEPGGDLGSGVVRGGRGGDERGEVVDVGSHGGHCAEPGARQTASAGCRCEKCPSAPAGS